MYTSRPQLYEVKTALRYHDTFINCSVLSTTNVHVIWKYRNVHVNISNTDKYTKNSSGLIIHNLTNDDEGQYVCSIVQLTLKAYITVNVNCKKSYAVYWICIQLHILGGPELLFQQNSTVVANVSEEVILNCTVSASPDAVYSWSFPHSCLSCPNNSNDSVLIFTAEDITNSGEYTCIAENEYGNLSVIFHVTVTSKSSIDH